MTPLEEHQAIHEVLSLVSRTKHEIAILQLLAREQKYKATLYGISVCATVGAEDCARVARMVLEESNAVS